MPDSQHAIFDERFLEKLTHIVLSNLNNEQFGVTDLSEKIGLSRSHLYRKLKLISGQSISQFICEVRLKEAHKLLSRENLAVSEVAFRVGFNNPSYFNKCFHDYFGYPPGETRSHIIENALKKDNFRFYFGGKDDISKKWFLWIVIGILIVVIAAIILSVIKKNKEVEKVKSIAILPFKNLSASEDNQYFADGLVDDLLYRLSILEDLKVISHKSSEMFRHKGDKTIREIADILGVNYILEGSIQKENNTVKIIIQLIDTNTDDHIFSKVYSNELREIFKVQGEIAEEITSELSLALSKTEKKLLRMNKTNNPEAIKFYQLGLSHSCYCTTNDFNKSIEYFTKAIKIDSLYGLAYAGLAITYAMKAKANYQWFGYSIQNGDSSLYFAVKAIELDPTLAGPHVALGMFYANSNWNWSMAEKEYKKAINLDPNYSLAYLQYARMLHTMGKYKEARKYINKAIELNPLAFDIRYISAYFYYNTEQFDKAGSEVQLCMKLKGNKGLVKSLQYNLNLRQGNDSAAYISWIKPGIMAGHHTREEYDSVYNIGGNDQIIKWYLEEERFWPPNREYLKIAYYAMLKDKEKTLDLLEMALDSGRLEPWHTSLWEYKFVRPEPRFLAIRKKMGLPPLEP